MNRSHEVFQKYLKWIQFVEATRQFFINRNFAPALTPTLVQCPGTELHLNPFSTQFELGAYKQTFFLPTSPELSLKKLLTLGLGSAFEIKTVFRNGEITSCHQPEFSMLEWYRVGGDLMDLQNDIRDLVSHLSTLDTLASTLAPKTTTVAGLFFESFQFRLTPTTSLEELKVLSKRIGLLFLDSEDWNDLFHRIWVTHIDPNLDTMEGLFVSDYPPSQAALAELKPTGWAQRFEFYWQNLEIGNAYYELRDPKEQRRRMESDVAARQTLGKMAVPADEAFLHALDVGLPACSGIAMGLERLFMAMHGYRNISDFMPFALNPTLHQS